MVESLRTIGRLGAILLRLCCCKSLSIEDNRHWEN